MAKREILRPMTNIPVLIKLMTDPTEAKAYKDQKYGSNNYLYIIEDLDAGEEKVMYATDTLQTTMLGAKLAKGMEIQLTKAEAGGKKIQWQIQIQDVKPSKTDYATKDENPPETADYPSNGLPGWKLKEISIWMQVAMKEAVLIQTARIQAGVQTDLDDEQLVKDTNRIYNVMKRANTHFVGLEK